jgi:hypothetical protein
VRRDALRPLTIACGLLLSGCSDTNAQTAPAAIATVPPPMAIDNGPRLQEFVIGVRSLERSLPAFTQALRWRVIERGRVDATVARAWNLPVDTAMEQALVGSPASPYGHVRLVQIDVPGREPIRPGARWWDTGGMFNLNVLVRDLDATIAGLRALGWTATGEPASYARPGGVSGRSMIMVGPDDLVLSFQQRIAPVLSGWPAFEGASHIEVGYQIVRDLDAWLTLYTGALQLPLSGAVRTDFSARPIGINAYGLPESAVGFTDGRQANISLRSGHEQSFGVRQFTRASGRDFSLRARPPNLGITSVRMPVPNLALVRDRLRAASMEFVSDTQIVRLSSTEAVQLLIVRSPGGSGLWLELFAPDPGPMSESELREFTREGRSGTWTRFNNQLTGSIWWFPDGTARVKWDAGNLDERGTWAIKGNAVCTAWTRLRNNRELCVHHHRLGQDRTQSFRVGDGGPDGVHLWQAAGRLGD